MIVAAAIVLMIAGASLRLWCILELREAGVDDFERIRVPTRWTRLGPYRLAHHPMYLGSFVLYAGFGILILDSLMGAFLAVYLYPFLRSRMIEEDDLREQFPSGTPERRRPS